jgi:hypothetical protein
MCALVTAALAMEPQSPDKAIVVSHESIVPIVAQIQRADYEGDRAGLNRLYGVLTPIPQDDKLASRVLYWRGFAL